MGFLQPLAILLLPVLAAIVALYLLRFRRPLAPIPSVTLWDELLRDREANAFWQRLHVSVLLVLQLLFALLLIAAIARPWLESGAPRARHLALVIDISASMSGNAAPDTSRSRLEVAKSEALATIDSMSSEAVATLITAGSSPAVVVPATSDKARLRAEVNGLRVGPTDGDVLAAVRLAAAVTTGKPQAVIKLFSDGAFASLVGRLQLNGQDLQFAPAIEGRQASAANNQGITALSVQEGELGRAVYVQIASSAPVTMSRRVELLVDGVPWEARTTEFGPGETRALVVPSLPIASRVVSARLAGSDSMPMDDEAWVVGRGLLSSNVLLVTNGSRFLEVALAVLPGVTVYSVAPERYDPNETLGGRPFELTVVDAGVPTNTLEALPEGSVLAFAPAYALPGLEVTGTITEPVPVAPGAGIGRPDTPGNPEPLADAMLDVGGLASVRIALARKLELSDDYKVLLDSDKGPLIAARGLGRRFIGVTAFALTDTDLPLQTAFPILVRDLVSLLQPERSTRIPASTAPETSVRIVPASERVTSILVEDPLGLEYELQVPSGDDALHFANTLELGTYYVTHYNGEEIEWQDAFAVNLFSRSETTTPASSTPGLPVARAPDVVASFGGEEIWRAVVVAAILVVLAEWGYANRIGIRRAVTAWRARRAALPGERG